MKEEQRWGTAVEEVYEYDRQFLKPSENVLLVKLETTNSVLRPEARDSAVTTSDRSDLSKVSKHHGLIQSTIRNHTKLQHLLE